MAIQHGRGDDGWRAPGVSQGEARLLLRAMPEDFAREVLLTGDQQVGHGAGQRGLTAVAD